MDGKNGGGSPSVLAQSLSTFSFLLTAKAYESVEEGRKADPYTAICVKHIFNVNFARGQGTFGATGPCGRNVVDSLTAGFGHRDSS